MEQKREEKELKVLSAPEHLIEFSKEIHSEAEILKSIRENYIWYNSTYNPDVSIVLVNNILKINYGFSEAMIDYLNALTETPLYPRGRIDMYYVAKHNISFDYIRYYLDDIIKNPYVLKQISRFKELPEDIIRDIINRNVSVIWTSNNPIADYTAMKLEMMINYQKVPEDLIIKYWDKLNDAYKKTVSDNYIFPIEFLTEKWKDIGYNIDFVKYLEVYSPEDMEKLNELVATIETVEI